MDGGRGAETACKVCGDKASGKHYGVPSCDGCRGFFKRSIRRNLDYVCKENNRCVVDVTRRNQCQACRFSKCLRVNMKKDAVQHERAPRACMLSPNMGQGRRPSILLGSRYSGTIPPFSFPPLLPTARGYLDISLSTEGFGNFPGFTGTKTDFFMSPINYQMGNSAYLTSHLLYPSIFGGQLPKTEQSSDNASQDVPWSDGNTGISDMSISHQAKEDEVTSSQETTGSQGVNSVQQCDDLQPTPSSSVFQKSSVLPIQKPGTSTRKLLDSFWELKQTTSSNSETDDNKVNKHNHRLENLYYDMFIIGKNLAVNNDPSLKVKEQKSNCCEMMYEAAAQMLFLTVKWVKAVPSFLRLDPEDQDILLRGSWRELFILTAAQWGLPINEESGRSPDLQEHARHLNALSHRFNQLRVDDTEYACLKAAILFRPDILTEKSRGQIEWLQDQILETLQRHSPVRCSRLILLLPAVARLAASSSLEELFFKSTVGDVAIEKILRDIDHNINPHYI